MRALFFSLFTALIFTSCQSQITHQCPFPYDNHQTNDECGFIEVPRNWDTNSSETTKLGYIVIRSKSNTRKEDPVVFLQGGPGGSVLNLVNIYSRLNIDADRDFILYDQRGIDFSEELCPGLNLQLIEVMALDLNIDEEIKELKQRVTACTDYIKTDDRQFSTMTNVKDLEALRKHLGYKQLNLFGGSYGTRLGLKYMEHYPNHVRSAVLSSLFPPDIRMYDNLFSNFNNALDKVFTDCSKDSNCNTDYPNLKSEFLKICDQLKTHPISIKINGDDFILNQQDMLLFIHQMLYNNQTIETIPEFIEALKEKNISYISRTVARFIPRVTILNLAVYYAVMTADEGDFNNQDKVSIDNANLMFTDTGLSIFSADPVIIKSWPSVPVASNRMNTVKSDIPTLLISGDFDPVTPVKNGNLTAKYLGNNQHFVFKNNGHVPINPCFFKLAKQFLEAPTAKLDGSCSGVSTVLDWD